MDELSDELNLICLVQMKLTRRPLYFYILKYESYSTFRLGNMILPLMGC